MTKIDIISGFLGAGKTTLIKKLLDSALKGQKLVLIENEFGEIGIDGGFLKDAGINITEMNSGCICCSLSGDFSRALKEVIDRFSPERVIIEPSGVGKLSDVIRAVGDVELHGVVLNSCSTVVDATRFKIYHKNFGEFFDNQISSAQTVLLSHTDGLSDEKIQACVDVIKQLNPEALVSTTGWDELSGEQLLAAIEQGKQLVTEDIAAMLEEHDHDHEHHHEHEHEHHHEHEHEHHHDHEHEHDHEHHHEHEHDHHHHHADDVFTSWGTQTTATFDKTRLESILSSLTDAAKYGNVIRAKGIVRGTDGGWIHFDYVPGEPEIRDGAADVTGRVCVIGAEINEQALEQLFS